MTAEDIADVEMRMRRRRESMLAVDDMVKAIEAKLTELRLLNDTIVVLSSDNGFLRGSHRWNGKGVPYEEASGVTLFMRGPGIPAGEVRKELVLNIDLTATILDWAGVLPRHLEQLDGKSLEHLLHGTRPGWRKAILTVMTSAGAPFSAIRTNAYLYARYAGDPHEEELYDLNADPYELVNQAARPDQVARVKRLRDTLNILKSCKGPGCWIE